MVSFEEFRLLLVLYYDAKLISDEDFVVLYEMFQSTNSSFPYYEYPRFDLNNMNDAECKLKRNLDLRRKTYQLLLKLCRFRRPSSWTREAWWMEWKAFACCSDDLLIHADVVIWSLVLDVQFP